MSITLLDIIDGALDKLLTRISQTKDEKELKKLYKARKSIKTIWRILHDEELRLIEEGKDSNCLIREFGGEMERLASK